MNKAQEVALWAALAAAAASLLAIAIFDVFDADQWAEYLGALIVAAVTFVAVYAQQRLDFAKKRENGERPPTTLKH